MRQFLRKSEIDEAHQRFLRTVIANPWMRQRPIESETGKVNERQVEFLCEFGLEGLYGGAAGGGKSSALLMAAAQFVEQSPYAALILRRTYKDLALPGALMDRSQEWWGGSDAHWDAKDHTWRFPSGATITFGYLEAEQDKYRYQSSEFQFIGFDELTQFSETQYLYLFSRLRKGSASDIPLRMRSASNPGGVGHIWVKTRFVSGAATSPDRFFIRALLPDNPFTNQEEYERNLDMLDPMTRDQLKKGDWDVFLGGRCKPEWMRYYCRADAVGNYWSFGPKKYHKDIINKRFLTVDAAASVKETSKDDPDWTVISSWGQTPCGLLVWLGCHRLRVEVPDIFPAIVQEYVKHRAGKARIEGGGMQNAVPQTAKRLKLPTGGMMNVVPYTPGSRDKLDRVTDFLNMAEAGRVWLPLDDPEFPLAEVKAELFRFTGDPKKDGHDDIVDTAAQAGEEVTRGMNVTHDFTGQGKFGSARAGISFTGFER